jgi:predicted RecB family nuclease
MAQTDFERFTRLMLDEFGRVVVELARQHDRLDGLHQLSFRRYVQEGGSEFAVSEAVRVVNLMLTGTTSVASRMNLLLDLHEIVKHPK